jgi:hypothetical protein
VASKARDEGPSVDDSITGNFTLLSLVLKQIQSMALRRVTDGGDEFLVAGANVEGGVVVFKRMDSARLQEYRYCQPYEFCFRVGFPEHDHFSSTYPSH